MGDIVDRYTTFDWAPLRGGYQPSSAAQSNISVGACISLRVLDSIAAEVTGNGNDMWGFRPKRKMQIPELPFRCREEEPQALPVSDFRFRLVRHHRQLAALSDRVKKA